MPPPDTSALATTQPQTLALRIDSIDDLARLARVFAASGLFGRNGNQDTQTAECAIRLMAGMEAGFSPFASATGVHIINGRPAFSANLLAQAVRRHPLYDYRVMEQTATNCRIRFLAGRETLGESVFTIEMAERAGLLKNPTWKSYPESMLFARALSSGMRTHCPDALGGAPAYVPEELGDTAAPVEVVTVSEEHAPQQQDASALVAAAHAACQSAGLTDAGIERLAIDLSGGHSATLDRLAPGLLDRLARAGVSAETVARCNGEPSPAHDSDDLPLAWS